MSGVIIQPGQMHRELAAFLNLRLANLEKPQNDEKNVDFRSAAVAYHRRCDYLAIPSPCALIQLNASMNT